MSKKAKSKKAPIEFICVSCSIEHREECVAGLRGSGECKHCGAGTSMIIPIRKKLPPEALRRMRRTMN